MEFIPPIVLEIFDWILARVIIPFFSFCSNLLNLFLIKPFDIIGCPLAIKVASAAIFTALVSILIRKMLKVDEKELAFQRAFLERKKAQEYIEKIDDWKKQKVLYDASDEDLDERFNEYMAQRFARYGLTYLLPVFLMLFWLDHLPEVISLKEKMEGVFVILFPRKIMGVPGISLPLLFLLVYCLSLLIYFKFRKKPKIEI